MRLPRRIDCPRRPTCILYMHLKIERHVPPRRQKSQIPNQIPMRIEPSTEPEFALSWRLSNKNPPHPPCFEPPIILEIQRPITHSLLSSSSFFSTSGSPPAVDRRSLNAQWPLPSDSEVSREPRSGYSLFESPKVVTRGMSAHTPGEKSTGVISILPRK